MISNHIKIILRNSRIGNEGEVDSVIDTTISVIQEIMINERSGV